MSCRICYRVKETGKMFLEGNWLYDYNRCDAKLDGTLTLRLYLTHDGDRSNLKGTLEGKEIQYPIMTTEIGITHCPFCGEELNGHS